MNVGELPPVPRDYWMLHIDDDADRRAEVDRYRAMSPDEKGRVLSDACQAAMAILRSRPDAGQVLAYEEPRSAEAQAIWQRLREKRDAMWWRP